MDGTAKIDGELPPVANDQPREPAAPVPAVDISIVATLAGDRQVQIRTAFLQETAEPEANAILDRLFRVADRQKARYEIDDLRDKLYGERGVARGHADLEADFERVEKEHAKAQADRDVQIAELKATRDGAYEDGYNAHRRSGRAGDYEPKGGLKATLGRLDAQIKSLEEQKTKADNEREAHMKGVEINRERFKSETERLEGELAKRLKLI
jgi:hypothetical protein